MNTPTAVTEEEAKALIQHVLGSDRTPTFATTPMVPGDIALILREGGGCQIMSTVSAEPHMGDVAMRGMVAMCLYKMAHDPGLMATVLTVVSEENAANPPIVPAKGLDS